MGLPRLRKLSARQKINFMQKLLLIHPDARLVALYQKALSERFSIDSAYDGLSGLRQIRSGLPHVIVSEFILPKLSGISLLAFVRKHPQLYATPFIFLSSSHPELESLNLGATDWLHLPLTSPEILGAKCDYYLKNKIYV